MHASTSSCSPQLFNSDPSESFSRLPISALEKGDTCAYSRLPPRQESADVRRGRGSHAAPTRRRALYFSDQWHKTIACVNVLRLKSRALGSLASSLSWDLGARRE
ncbi:hypothetical protein L226DRAFT_533325 [Lentinus tigrinus ALCF2SS1-7]|uniref:uncharacterized protein n=1 Tax=Lentinus tigrinus ALCF2SS1-7 TaxID=1328758 RepID=UPI0011662F88|nr:hypothetical protein L226DRAFT_533325 [Lentinus tigrinus ALCF2SS1-7]